MVKIKFSSQLTMLVGTLSVLVVAVAEPPAKSNSKTRFELAPMKMGDPTSSRDVFRFETFGDEGFWTDAARMPQGMEAAHVTPIDAMKAGLSVDVEMIDDGTREAFTRELKTDLSEDNAPMLNDPATTTKLVNMNAVIGLVSKEGKVGVTCALCHSITDGSIFSLAHGGGIGKRIDGPIQHNLNVGKLLSIAANSRAFFAILQLQRDGKTIGRAPAGLTKDSSEREVDAYLANPKYYPIGTFDDTPDGIGNSVHIPPLFRQDLAAPYESSGQNATAEDFSNTVYTALFDQTNLATPGGHAFLKLLGGDAGAKLSEDYVYVLRDTHVTGYPYVKGSTTGKPGTATTPVGTRVPEKLLLDLNAYMAQMEAPRGVHLDIGSINRGQKVFNASCTNCHGSDQSMPVPPILVPMTKIFPGYRPEIIAKRKPPLSPIQNSPGTFDDKMIVVDASPAGKIRGNALPLLLDLARKPVFLHDDSVKSLDSLSDSKRGPLAPHPSYVANPGKRKDLINFLCSLDTEK